MPNENLPLLEKALYAIAGSGVALMFLPGNWKRKLALLVCGAVTSYYVGPYVALLLAGPEASIGFLTGMLSMAAADGLFRAWYALDLRGIAASWLTRRK